MKQIFQQRIIICCCLMVITISCKKESNDPFPATEQVSNTPANARAIPPFHIEVVLRGEGSNFGLIKFRQDNDPSKIIRLDTWVRGLAPNHSYILQRAVDTNLDGNCTGTNWLTLGKGLVPQSIMTDERGTGSEELWRDISSVPSGSTFDIHFRVLDAVSMAVVLTSGCYEYVVR